MKTSRRRSSVNKNSFTTRSGTTIKLNRSLSERIRAHKELKSRRRADRLNGLPKSRVKRMLYRLNPRRMAKYWFSRDGGIMALKILGIGFIVGFLVLVGMFAYFRKDLPNLRDISGNNIGGSIRYYDKTGQTLLWEDYDAVKRIPVKDAEISPYIKDATVAVEDKDFFKHGGFDVRGIARAGINDTLKHGSTQGGSTITQQLVKLTQNWTNERTVTRKVKELILAVELERSYTKQEILTGYLNTAPYGGVDYGVEAASRDYFQKSAKDLTLDEAVTLAAIPKSPTHYNPRPENTVDPAHEGLIGRKNYILDLMVQQGKITPQQRDEAKKVDVLAKVKPPQPKFNGIRAPWFVLTAKEQLETKFGPSTVKRGGWKVTTTLDLGLQTAAEEQVNKGMIQVRRQGGDTTAFVAEDVKTAQVVALVGGSDFNNPDFGQNNYAADYRLPPGSSFKPYDYTSLIEHSTNFGAGSVLYDTKGVLPGYPCTNKALPKQGGNCLQDYDFREPGPMTLRYALGGSRNIPAVKAMLITGIDKTIQTADKMMGNSSAYQCYQDSELTKTGPCYASSAIGDGAYLHVTDHVNGYSTISRNGLQFPQTFILRIEDAAGKKVDEWKPPKGEQVVRPDAAYIVADMLSDPNASYFPAGRKPHRYKNSQGTWNFAMKTGTTNDGKDGWMMGFSTQYAAGVWVGYHNRQKVMSGTMEAMTQPIWQGWMQAAHKDLKPEDRVKPPTVQTLPAFIVRSHVGIGSVEPSPATDLFPSWYKQPAKNTGNKTIDIVSNKLATDCTPARARKDMNNADANSFSGDTFANGGNGSTANTQASDDVHICGEAKPAISIDSTPSSCSNSCTIAITVSQGAHPINGDQYKGTVNILVGGQQVQSYQIGSAGTANYTFTYGGSGDQDVTAQVIDSVLYDASSGAASINFSGGSSSPLTLSASAAGANVTLRWSGRQGVSGVYEKSNDALVCIGTSGNPNGCSASVAQAPPGNYYAKDNVGTISNTVTVGP